MEVMYGSPYRYFTSIFLKEWKYGDGKKIVFEIFADSDCTLSLIHISTSITVGMGTTVPLCALI